MTDKYFLSAKLGAETVEREVSLTEYCKAERQAGFRPKLSSDHPSYMLTPATGGFSSGGIGGRVQYGTYVREPRHDAPTGQIEKGSI